jgi:hypothetical protein
MDFCQKEKANGAHSREIFVRRYNREIPQAGRRLLEAGCAFAMSKPVEANEAPHINIGPN